MRCRRRNARALRCNWDEWLLSCRFLNLDSRTSFQKLDSTGVRKDSATPATTRAGLSFTTWARTHAPNRPDQAGRQATKASGLLILLRESLWPLWFRV